MQHIEWIFNKWDCFFYACSQYQGDLDIEVSIDDINRILAYQGGNQREIIKTLYPL